MPEPLIPRRDLDFLLFEWLGAARLAMPGADAEIGRETIDAFLDLSDRLAAEQFLPLCKAADSEEPHRDATGAVHVLPALAQALHAYAAAGLFGAGFPVAVGGSAIPALACSASFAQFCAASIATAAYVMLTVANARLLTTFGTPEQIRRFALPQIEGRWLGTMCLSEPQAGSSLADIRTRARHDGADALGTRYRLTGNKMWISGGDHDIAPNIVHLVLAKVANADGRLPEGSGGISLFVVPKVLADGQRNDIVVAGLNHKMGYRGTVNCLLNFGEAGGALGWMVGTPGDGLRLMFRMMNEARIGVGLGAAALACRGYRHSLRYAGERHQGRRPGVKDGPPVALREHADVRSMLLAQKAYAEGALALCLYCAQLVDTSADPQDAALLDLLTPVAKTWPSEHGLAANDLAIQIHGGYGYTRDFDVEQLYRDNRLNAIHEGTTGIQALDLLGRKILAGDGTGLGVLRTRIGASTAGAAERADLAGHAHDVRRAFDAFEAGAARLHQIDRALALRAATPLLRAFGHIVVGWLWLDQARCALAAGAAADCSQADRRFYAGKLQACRFFMDEELPRIDQWLHVARMRSERAAEQDTDDFAEDV